MVVVERLKMFYACKKGIVREEYSQGEMSGSLHVCVSAFMVFTSLIVLCAKDSKT